MRDYAFLLAADLLYALQFLFTKIFEDKNESSLIASMNFSLGTGLIICLYALFVSRFHIGVTPFSLLMAAVNAFITIALNFCSIRSLSYVNLSVYAVFIMMGGMLVPSLYGVLFLHEPVTAGKIIGTVLVISAMVCGVEKRRAHKGAWKYYAAVFLLNGMFAVCQKIHQTHMGMNVGSGSFLFLTYAAASLLSAATIWICGGRTGFAPLTGRSGMPGIIGYGIANCTAELLSLTVMTTLPASVQFGLVSGGVILFSSLISVLRREKQDRLTILSMVLSACAIITIGM